jgi:hypothetical protein
VRSEKAVLLEKVGEQKVVNFATSNGCLVLKLNVLGQRGWPDRMFIYKGKVFFIEFKQVGLEPNKLQSEIHARIRQHQIDVHVIDNWSDGIEIISQITKSRDNLSGLHDGRHLHGRQ